MPVILRSAAASAALLLLVSATASAQFGDALKRGAKRAAERAAGDRAASATGVTSSSDALAEATYGKPFTADTLSLVLKGLAAEAPLLRRRDSAAERRLEIERQRGDLRHASMEVVDRYRESDREDRQCSDDFMEKLNDERAEKSDARGRELAANPVAAARFTQDMQKFSIDIAQLIAKGDTVAAMKLQSEFYAKHLGIDMSGDSAAIRARCGAPPAQPKALTDDSLLTVRLDAASEEVRAIEDTMQVAGARASGLSADRFALARERLMVWKDRRATGAKGFSAEENALLEGRREEIERALGS